MINSISIHGLRGFGKKVDISFAKADNIKEGSGMTIFVGSNNSGKTTILEALRSFNCGANNSPAFSIGKRNTKDSKALIHLEIKTDNGYTYRIDSVNSGGSNTVFTCKDSNGNISKNTINIFVLQSRRYYDFEFYKQGYEREAYLRNQQVNGNSRSAELANFNARLFKMQENKENFDSLLKEVLGYNMKWYIDMQDNGKYFLKITINNQVHTSEGLGDGIWSVFTICDALYDSKEGDVICIDEPELSLHPAYQKRVLSLLKRYSKDRQIIMCTHSPYFVDIKSIVNGANLYRTVKESDGDIKLFSLQNKTKAMLKGFIKDIQKPHILGLEAKEIFFLEDNVIITEGQDDVVMYNLAAEKLEKNINGEFFGWGSGGSSNIRKIATILKDLGYKKVVAIFDNDKELEKEKFDKDFEEYKSYIISKKDVRDKDAVAKKDAVEGLMSKKGELKEDSEDEIKQMFENIEDYFNKSVEID